MRHVVEVEKIDVLTKHYDVKIEKELKKIDGSKSTNDTETTSNVATAADAKTAN